MKLLLTIIAVSILFSGTTSAAPTNIRKGDIVYYEYYRDTKKGTAGEIRKAKVLGIKYYLFSNEILIKYCNKWDKNKKCKQRITALVADGYITKDQL